MEIVHDAAQLDRYLVRPDRRSRPAVRACRLGQAAAADRPLSDRRHRGRRRLPRRRQGHLHRRHHGAHRGGRHPFRRLGLLAAAAQSLGRTMIAELDRQTRALALALKVGGLMNVQYAIKDGDIYVLEVNPRASRTVPFVAKVIGLPVAKIAARIMAGETLASFKLTPQNFAPGAANHVGVKEAVFPFARFGAGGRHRARPGDEIDRRGDGHRPRLQRRLRQEPARRRRAAAEERHRVRLGPGRRQAAHPGGDPAALRTGTSRSSPPPEPSATWPSTGSPRSRSTRSRKAARTSSTPSKTARFSWFSTPPRGPRRWPTAGRCGALPSCIKCRTTPLFPGPSPRRRASKPISGATSRYVRCRAISGPKPNLIRNRGRPQRRYV